MQERVWKIRANLIAWAPAVGGGALGVGLAQLLPLPDIKSWGFYGIIHIVVIGYGLLMIKVVSYAQYFASTKHKLMEELRKCPGQGGLLQHITNFYGVILLMLGWAFLGFLIKFNQISWEISSEIYYSVYFAGGGILLGMFYRFYRFHQDILAYERGEDPAWHVFHWEFFWTQLFFDETRKKLPPGERKDDTVTLTPESYKAEAAALMNTVKDKS